MFKPLKKGTQTLHYHVIANLGENCMTKEILQGQATYKQLQLYIEINPSLN